MKVLYDLIENIEKDIDMYYQYSFRVWPEKCYPVLLSIIQHIQQIDACLTAKQQKKMQSILKKIVAAMESQDFVLVRDLLHYELRLLINSFKKGGKHNLYN